MPADAWAFISASMAAPFGTGTRIEVYGSQGALFMSYPSFNPPPTSKLYGARAAQAAVEEIPIPAEYFPFEDSRDDRMMPFRLMAAEFVRAIRETGQAGATVPHSPPISDGPRAAAVERG